MRQSDEPRHAKAGEPVGWRDRMGDVGVANEEHEARHEAARKYRSTMRHWQTSTVIANTVSIVIIFMLVFVVKFFLVPSGSMEPTLVPGDRLVTISAGFRIPMPGVGELVLIPPKGETFKPGDIVCFYAPSGDVYVKRIVANGGDKVEISNDRLYVNGEESPYQGPGTGAVEGTWNLSDDEYFMMGDNRGNSQDSRYIGTIKADRIISRVVGIYWPVSDIRGIGNAPAQY